MEDYDPSEQYPLCTAMNEDGNEFRETELRDAVCNWCGKYVNTAILVRQIEIKNKLSRGEELLPEDIADCLLLEDLPGEVWKPVVGYEEQYEISNKGRLKNSKRHTINHSKIAKEYREFTLFDNNERSYIGAHRLVAFAFKPPTEEDLANGRDQVNHIDGHKDNNCVENLEWITAQENTVHAFVTDLRKNNVSISQHIDMIDKYNQGYPPRLIHELFYPNISKSVISATVHGSRYKHHNVAPATKRPRMQMFCKGCQWTIQDIIDVRILRQKGLLNREIADIKQIPKYTVERITGGKIYKNITREAYPEETNIAIDKYL